MKNLNKILALGISATVLFAACSKDSDNPDPDPKTEERKTGWTSSSEDKSKYPREISFSFGSSQGNTNLPSKVNLLDKLPPVGNQGNYGTCVAWSVGYGLRSFLNGVEKNLTAQQLAQPANQSSPTDLWMSISSADKGTGCGGSNFEPALNVLVSRGIATMQTAPYTSLNCGGAPAQAWTTEAGKYKIKNYRMIDKNDMTVTNLKTHLAQGRVISFGAMLGDNFMSWTGSGVLSSDTYLKPGSQHAGHAIVLAGYDDSKGANGAFLVYNSWSTEWGDEGNIWIGYDFFINKFVDMAFVVTSDNNVNPNDNTEIDPGDRNTGNDLAAYNAFDQSFSDPYNYPGCNRNVYFNIYNTGNTTIKSSSKWSAVYMYYNAFNANDYGILTHFYYTNEVTGAVPFPQVGLPLPIGGIGWCINNDIPAGKNIAAVYFNQPKYEYFVQPYRLPALNGYYYIVLMADAFNTVQEVDEQNNFYFIANANGYPYYFQNGIPYGGSSTKTAPIDKLQGIENAPVRDVREFRQNAYSPGEIRNMIIKHRESGELERLTKNFDASNKVPVPMGK